MGGPDGAETAGKRKLESELMRGERAGQCMSICKADCFRLEGYEQRRDALQRRFGTEKPSRAWVSDDTRCKLKERRQHQALRCETPDQMELNYMEKAAAL